MANTITMRSKVTRFYDYTEMDLGAYIPAFTPDEAQLAKDIERILKAHGTKEEVDIVSDGDMVTLSCDSETPKFNKKNLVVMVGKGLFSKALEEQLIGQKKGEPFDITADGAKVHGVAEKILHVTVPALSDETVASFGMDGIETVKDLKGYCADRQIDRLLDERDEMDQAAARVWMVLSENSVFALDEQEEKRALAQAEQELDRIGREMPQFETEEDKQDFLEEFGDEEDVAAGEIDMEELVRNMCLTEVKLGALGCAVAAQEGQLLTDEDYEAYIRRFMEALPDQTEEEIRAKYPVEEFAIERYNHIICERIDNFVSAVFKQKMNPYR